MNGPNALAHDLVRTSPANGDHPIPGGESRASFQVADVHQARISEGVGEWGWQMERTNKGIG